jgi:hypothetical protein
MKSHHLFSANSPPVPPTASHILTSNDDAKQVMAKSRVAIITLNILRDKPGYSIYRQLDAVEKIKLLITQINFQCEKLNRTEANAMWLMAWRENGVTDSDTSFVSSITKSYLKTELVKLTIRYPQLVVVGGLSSVKTFKDIGCHKKLNEVAEYYQLHQGYIDKHTDESVKIQWDRHLKQFKQVQASRTITLDVLRNTVYIFQQGRKLKHDKICPFHETMQKNPLSGIIDHWENFIFQPAKKPNAENFFTLRHPVTRQSISIGVEICFEHYAGYFKSTTTNQALLQLVLSDYVVREIKNMSASFLIHIDSIYSPTIFQQHLNNKEAVEINAVQDYFLEQLTKQSPK